MELSSKTHVVGYQFKRKLTTLKMNDEHWGSENFT